MPGTQAQYYPPRADGRREEGDGRQNRLHETDGLKSSIAVKEQSGNLLETTTAMT